MLSVKNAAGVCHYGVSILTHPVEYAGAGPWTPSALADVVDGMVDWDIASPDQAQALNLKFIPHCAPLLLIQYRTPALLSWQFGSHIFRDPHYNHFVTKLQCGVITVRSRGPLGVICVHLRPEAAARLLGEQMQGFLDAQIGLDDIFSAGQISLLEEMLSEAKTSVERFAYVERFLAANLRTCRAKPIAFRAAGLLRRNPNLGVRRLAARLDVGERHLQRTFQAIFGMPPKQFARIARIESAMSARARGAAWAEIAYATGFTDQAHMVNDFTKIVGVTPAQLVRPPFS
jgi:AraC-like DNA-binding protein